MRTLSEQYTPRTKTQRFSSSALLTKYEKNGQKDANQAILRRVLPRVYKSPLQACAQLHRQALLFF